MAMVKINNMPFFTSKCVSYVCSHKVLDVWIKEKEELLTFHVNYGWDPYILHKDLIRHKFHFLRFYFCSFTILET